MRARAILTTLALLGSGLAALVGTTSVTSPAAAAGERWCSEVAAPCIVSLTVDGATRASGADVTLFPAEEGYREMVATVSAATSTSQVVEVVVRTGTDFVPDRVAGRMALLDVDPRRTPSGHEVAIRAHPVRWAHGCDNAAGWPYPCPSTAQSNEIVLDADIEMLDDRTDTTIGMYAGTNATYNGIFFDELRDGSRALTTELVAPHFFAGGTTPVVGLVRYRLSYRQMRLELGIPDPETLTPTSLAGSVNNGKAGGVFTTWHDPDGGGFFIQAGGFTFSVKRLKVTPARITPARPALTKATRLAAARARLVHGVASPRGAKVTGYVARCVSPRGHRVTATAPKDAAKVVVKGLRRGTAYTCKVAATSKAGKGAWSAPRKVAARP